MPLLPKIVITSRQNGTRTPTTPRTVTCTKMPSFPLSASKAPTSSQKSDTAATGASRSPKASHGISPRCQAPLPSKMSMGTPNFGGGLHRTMSASAATRARPVIAPQERLSSRIPTAKRLIAPKLQRYCVDEELDFDADDSPKKDNLPSWTKDEELVRWFCLRMEAATKERAEAFPKLPNPTAEQVFGHSLERTIIRADETAIWE